MAKTKIHYDFRDKAGNEMWLQYDPESLYSDDCIELCLAPELNCVAYSCGLSKTQAIELAKHLLLMATK